MDPRNVDDLSDNETSVIPADERKELISDKGLLEGINVLSGKAFPKKDVGDMMPAEKIVDWDAEVQAEEEERQRAALLAEQEAVPEDDEDEEDDDDEDDSEDEESEEEPVPEEPDVSAKAERPTSGDMSALLADMSDVIKTLQLAVEAQGKVIQGLNTKVKKQSDEILELQSKARIEKNQTSSAIEALKVNLNKRVDDVSNSMSQVPPLVDRLLQASNMLIEKLPAPTQSTLQQVKLTEAEEETVKTIKKQVAKGKEFKIPRWMK